VAAGLVLALCVAVGHGLRAEQEAGKVDADLQKRIDIAKQLTQSDSVGQVQEQILSLLSKQFIDMMVARNPSKEKDIRELMEKVFGELSARKGEVTQKVAEIYARHFSLDELQQIVAFKLSPVGRKMETELPGIMQESISIGQAWGQEVGQEALRRFLEEAKSRGLDL
jgi:hypothetical protein